MQTVAIIPARGGSKGLPRKNIRLLCGKPLIAWTIEAALQAKTVGRVVVSTDDAEIATVSSRYGAEIVWRPKEISGDTSPSEAVLLHGLEQIQVTEGILVFLQCTSPLMLAEDIDGTVQTLKQADSAFTATRWHHFLWKTSDAGAIPVGHNKSYRPMRQQLQEPHYLEVGAVYAMDIAGFLHAQQRFFGRTDLYLVPVERSLEIDDETDFLLAELLLHQRLERNLFAQLPQKVEALVMDFDGVLTDNRVSVTEDGKEAVVCHRGDGWAIQRMKDAGIRLMILTAETNDCVVQRCNKLGLECVVASTDKLSALQHWLLQQGIDPQATVYVGNDNPDVPCLQYVGCGVVPADAYAKAKSAAKIVLTANGGWGCIRELANLMLVN